MLSTSLLNSDIPGTNQTVGEWANQQLQQGYLTGNVPPLLPPGLS